MGKYSSQLQIILQIIKRSDKYGKTDVDVILTRSPNVESVVFIHRDSEDVVAMALSKDADDNIEFQLGIGVRLLSLVFSNDGREIKLS